MMNTRRDEIHPGFGVVGVGSGQRGKSTENDFGKLTESGLGWFVRERESV